MNHAIKIEDFEHLTITKIEPVSDMLREFGHDLLDGIDRVQEIECRRRDGFIPWSHNKGGWRNHGYTNIDYIMGTGYLTGSFKVNDLIEKIYYREIEDCYKNFLDNEKLHCDLTWDDLDQVQQYEYQEFESEWFSSADGYLDICFEYQGRYLGYDKGVHKVSLNMFINVTDAPYFRGSDDDIEVIISFRDLNSKSFKKKLEKAKKQLQDFMGSVDLW